MSGLGFLPSCVCGQLCVCSAVAEQGLHSNAACGVLVPWPGTESASAELEGGFLTTGSPRKSPAIMVSASQHFYRTVGFQQGQEQLGQPRVPSAWSPLKFDLNLQCCSIVPRAWKLTACFVFVLKPRIASSRSIKCFENEVYETMGLSAQFMFP